MTALGIGTDSFNTQPPEGGWLINLFDCRPLRSFNTQPPEGGWKFTGWMSTITFCFNTQPPEGGWSESWRLWL